MGVVYRQKGRSTWMLKYYRDGRPIYESSGTQIKDEAKKVLRVREGDIAKGVPITSKTGRVRFEDAAKDLINDYKTNNRKSLDELERRLKLHLEPYFGHRKLSTITTTDVRAFVAKRQDDAIVIKKAVTTKGPGGTVIEVSPVLTKQVSNGEINRELTVLKRMFTLAMQAGKILYRPHIPMLQEDNVRTGFFEREQFESVRSHLPASLQPVIAFAYVTGWRIASEVLPMEWRQVDFKAGEVRLDPGTTKNREGRVFKMTTQLRSLLEVQRDERDRLKKLGKICPYVFFRMVADKRRGDKSPRKILSLNKAWANACIAAGCPGRIPHDLRRTAIRNMVRAGVPERVAMKLSGHKTRSVFERYNIVSDGDLDAAAARLDAIPSHSSSVAKSS
ncbi:MAG: site-specific integrase [Acidobacteria bacterium]|nr:site-specific integrase [Acidobacteriota bacterium]